MSRRAPRRLADVLGTVTPGLAPPGTLAQVQAVWSDTVGPAVAERAEPVAERDGVLTVACREAVWAQELELMGPELAEQLNAALGRSALTRVRCRATPR